MSDDKLIPTNRVRPISYWTFLLTFLGIDLVLLFWTVGINLSMDTDLKAIASTKPAGLLFIPILISIFSRPLQDKVAHFKVRCVLPGCRAIELAERDHRIDVKKLKNGERVPPRGPKQNAWWYDRYKTVKHLPETLVAQQRYILFRDLAFMQAVSAGIIATACAVVGGTAEGSLIAFGLYAMFVVATRNRGEQFVQTAMAVWTPPTTKP